MNRNISGQNITEFIIILGIIVIGSIVALTFLGDNIKEMFTKSHKVSKEYKPFDWKNDSQKSANKKDSNTSMISGGSLGGTPEKPVVECQGNSCSMDFGTFILTDVPKNMGDVITTSGTSGGTESIAALLQQLIDQLIAMDSDIDTNLLKQLADKGFIVANNEQTIESDAELFLQSQHPIDAQKIITQNTHLRTQSEQFDMILGMVEDKYKNPANQNEQNVINVVKALSAEIQNLSLTMKTNVSFFQSSYDVNNVGRGQDLAQDILDSNTSDTTNLDSKIICKTGHGDVTHYNCK